jgi:hypothetical protein
VFVTFTTIFTPNERRHALDWICVCCRRDVVQHRPGEQEGDGDGARVARRRPGEHLQGQEGRAPRRLTD